MTDDYAQLQSRHRRRWAGRADRSRCAWRRGSTAMWWCSSGKPQTGGIPRHSDHLGYGIRDLRRFVSGPSYARQLTERAPSARARP